VLERWVVPDGVDIGISLGIDDISEAIGNSLIQETRGAGYVGVTRLCLFSSRNGFLIFGAGSRAT
jgi:hypothetical protein